MPQTLEQFIAAIAQHGVLPAGELDAFVAALPADQRPSDAQSLARALVAAGKLTKYQAAQIYHGKGSELVFGQYLLIEKLGEGGMGQVFKAQHRVMQRVVALKMLSPSSMNSPEAVQRFRREVRAAARLNHPNIVTAFDADHVGNTHYLVMECVEGQDLDSLVKKNGCLPVADAVNYMLQAAAGLAYAHAQGVVHRDIKPHNLLLDKSGAVKILDMGLARFDDGKDNAASLEGLTQSGVVMGTVDYMAPEQAEDTRKADARADIYSLGCTLFRLLLGRTPYSGESVMSRLMAHVNKPIPSLRAERDDVSPDLEAVVQRMMAKRAEDRYQRMEDLIADLKSCAAGTNVVHARAKGGTGQDNQLSDFLSGFSQRPASPGNAATQVIQSGETRGTIVPPAAAFAAGSQVVATVSTRSTSSARSGPAWSRDPRILVIGGTIIGVLLLGLWLALRGGDTRNTGSATNANARQTAAANFALDFNGKDSRVDIPSLRYDGSHPITLEATVTPRQTASRASVVGDTEYGGICILLGDTQSGHWQWIANHGDYQILSSPDKAIANEKVHLAGVLDGSKLRLFLNGKLVASGDAANPFQKSPLPFMIGANPQPNPPGFDAAFDGVIDEVRISKVARYSKNFTPATRFEPDADTLALYHFDDGQGEKLVDSSGNSHHGVIHNAKWVKGGGASDALLVPRGFAEVQRIAEAERAADEALQPIWAKAINLESDQVAMRDELRTFLTQHSGTPAATKACELLGPIISRIPSPLDQLNPTNIPEDAKAAWRVSRFDGSDVVAVLGEHRGRHKGSVRRVAYHPDGKWLATSSDDAKIRLWDADTLLLREEVHGASPVFARDGRLFGLAAGGICFWEFLEYDPKQTVLIDALPENPALLAVAPDGKLAATSHVERIRVWDLHGESPRELAVLSWPGHINSIRFDSQGKRLIGGNHDKTVRIWDVQGTEVKEVATLPGHGDWVYDVAISPDGKTLASVGAHDFTAHLWDLSAAEPQPGPVMQLGSAGCSLAFSGDGKTLAIGLWQGALWQAALWLVDLSTGQPVQKHVIQAHEQMIWGLSFSPDGKRLASGSEDQTVRVWDTETGKEAVPLQPGISSLALSDDGQFMATGDRSGVVRIAKLADGLASEEIKQPAHTAPVSRLRFSHDAKLLGTGAQDGIVNVWDLASRSERYHLTDGNDPIWDIDFSPDGRFLSYSGTYRKSATAVRMDDPSKSIDLGDQPQVVTAVRFSPGGGFFAAGQIDTGDLIGIWNLRSKQLLRTLTVDGTAGGVHSFAFSPDGRSIASAIRGHFLKVWDLDSGKARISQYFAVEGLSTAYCPDGSYIASSYIDGQLILWNSANGQRLRSWQLPAIAKHVEFAADGRHLLTLNSNGTVYIFRLFPRGSRLYPPLDEAWLANVAGMPPDEQVKAVAEELKKRNPGFDGAVQHTVTGETVTRLELLVDSIEDLSPVRALAGLKQLVCNANIGKSKLRDLWPLAGLKLEYLVCANSPVEQLDALAGMPLTSLIASYTQVKDVAPLQSLPLERLTIGSPSLKNIKGLRGLKLKSLNLWSSPVTDLSPLEGMPIENAMIVNTQVRNFAPLARLPLEVLQVDVLPELDSPALRNHATLKTINYKPVADFWREFDAQPVPITNSLAMKLTKIPAGKFLMGSPESESGRRDNEGPQREVTISRPFYLGVHEVTREQFQKIMDPNPADSPGPNNPVDSVSWLQAVEFCKRLSERKEEQEAGRVYRLPTEAEWEYACRALTTTAYYFGDDPGPLRQHAWFHENDGGLTHPVGQLLPNPWGLYDMAGNLFEFCADHFVDNAYQTAPATDPLVTTPNNTRVIRGGARSNPASESRSAARWPNHPHDQPHGNVGFRVACDIVSRAE